METRPLVLVVDDDHRALRTALKALSVGEYDVVTANDGPQALELMDTRCPDLVILDIVMPGMDGYALCEAIREDPRFESLPVLFLSGLDASSDKARAFAAGGTDFVEKPASVELLIDRVERHLRRPPPTDDRESQQPVTAGPPSVGAEPDFEGFKAALVNEFHLDGGERNLVLALDPTRLYEISAITGISEVEIAQRSAQACGYRFAKHLDAEDLELGVLSPKFARAKLMVPLRFGSDRRALVVTNPFDSETLLDLEGSVYSREPAEIVVTAPQTVREQLRMDRPPAHTQPPTGPPGPEVSSAATKEDRTAVAGAQQGAAVPELTAREQDHDVGADHPTATLSQSILEEAVRLRASDIHLDPKGSEAILRCRVDGDMREVRRLPSDAAQMVISRLKALAGMDIAERRKPQDGSLQALIGEREFKLRLATSYTPNGESVVIRLLEPSVDAVGLGELGMTGDQQEAITALAERTQGLILVVGPTGSGKSTTIFSVLSAIDTHTRNLISVEDPVEYRIPFAKQQPVNLRAGVTFETLLKSAVRQDPDILFLGELRDTFSAKAAVDFAASGHLTITSLHSSNAVTSIFRLERLGVTRSNMAEGLIGVVAQRLVKRLCSECAQIRPISEAEYGQLEPYTDSIPTIVGAPAGCEVCGGIGYRGRVGVYEVLTFDPTLLERVRSGAPIADIRAWISARGDYLIGDHAVECVRSLKTSVDEAVQKVLVEERPKIRQKEQQSVPDAGADIHGSVDVDTGTSGPPRTDSAPRILVVDDDPDSRSLMSVYLGNAGYVVTVAEDGAAALMKIAQTAFDLVLSDVHMPNLDGIKLLEILSLQGVDAPVVFLSADESFELEGLELGAADYIRKPVQKKTLLLRVRRVLGRAQDPDSLNQRESASHDQ